METLLTLCLLVMIAALCWPLFSKPFSSQRLRAAADQVRAQWTNARVEAMRCDSTYVFRYAVEGSQYRIERRAVVEAAPEQALDGNSGLSVDAPAAPAACRPIQGTLPEGVTFVSSETADDTRAGTVDASMDIDSASTATAIWSQPILFYPDGTTSTARLQLKNERGRGIELSLRGLTGVVRVGDIFQTQEGLP